MRKDRGKRDPVGGDLADALEAVIENPSDDEAQLKAKRILVRHLASLIVDGKSSSTRAVEIAAGVIGEMFQAIRPPTPDQRCRLCGRLAGKEIKVVIGRELAEHYGDGFDE